MGQAWTHPRKRRASLHGGGNSSSHYKRAYQPPRHTRSTHTITPQAHNYQQMSDTIDDGLDSNTDDTFDDGLDDEQFKYSGGGGGGGGGVCCTIGWAETTKLPK